MQLDRQDFACAKKEWEAAEARRLVNFDSYLDIWIIMYLLLTC